jgi:hypothetical protein
MVPTPYSCVSNPDAMLGSISGGRIIWVSEREVDPLGQE